MRKRQPEVPERRLAPIWLPEVLINRLWAEHARSGRTAKAIVQRALEQELDWCENQRPRPHYGPVNEKP